MHSSATPFPDTLPTGPGPHWIDVRTLCQILVRQITGKAARQRVRMNVSTTPTKAVVIGYAPQLLRALETVAAVTLRSMPDGGMLTLSVYQDPYVIVEFSGSGSAPGRSADGGDLDHMTRSWRRVELARPDADLTSARAIVQAHRGNLWQRNQTTGGMCTIVELPAAGPKEQYRPWRPRGGASDSR